MRLPWIVALLILVGFDLDQCSPHAYGEPLMMPNLILDQIEIINGEEQVFDIYVLEGGAYLTASFWSQGINILATFTIQGIENAEWKLQRAYVALNKKIKPIDAALVLRFVKQSNQQSSYSTQIEGSAVIENRSLKINIKDFTNKKFTVTYKKPWSVWDRWKLQRSLRTILNLPGITVPLFD